jgi:hypothetical protein
MIPLKFGLFWSGTELSFLRFLTFVSIRQHHPYAEIELYHSKKSDKNISWRAEKQDFQSSEKTKCYLSKLEDLDVKIIDSDLFPTYAPNYQSDLFRWWWLYRNGGFYLDTDQIILKPFDGLPLESDFIYSMYRAKSCGIYSPVGAIGSKQGSPIVERIMDEMMGCYDPQNYSSLGPFMFRDLYFKHRDDWEKKAMFNAPPNYFYPIPESRMIKSVYESRIHLTGESYALHWYGGHPLSQKFNKKVSEESISNDEDTISLLARPLLDYWYRRRK